MTRVLPQQAQTTDDLRRNGIGFPCFAGVIYHCAQMRRASWKIH